MKRIAAIILCIAMVLSFTGCGIIQDIKDQAKESEKAAALAEGNYHVLIPENERISYENGTFQDFDTYCVFTLDDLVTAYSLSDEGIYKTTIMRNSLPAQGW